MATRQFPAPGKLEKSWIQRNWKWVLPLTLLGGLILLIAFTGAILMVVFGSFRNSEVFQQAMATARANPEVARQLGQPVKAGWFFRGQIHISGSSGHADLAIPLSGPKRKGTLYIVADKRADRWRFRMLKIAVEGSEDRIDLLEDPERVPTEEPDDQDRIDQSILTPLISTVLQ